MFGNFSFTLAPPPRENSNAIKTAKNGQIWVNLQKHRDKTRTFSSLKLAESKIKRKFVRYIYNI